MNNNNIRNLNEIKTNSSIKYKKINKNLSTNNLEVNNSHKKNLKSSSSLKYNRHLINSHKLYSSNSVSSNINRLSTISSENLITNYNSSSKRISSIENKIKNKIKNKENKSIRYLSTSSSPNNHRNFSNNSINNNNNKKGVNNNKKMLLFSDAKKNSVIKLNKDLHNLNLKNKRIINNSNYKKISNKNIKNILNLQSQNSSLLISPKTERQTINYNNNNNKSNLLTINSNKKTINISSKNYHKNISPISKLNNLILSISPRKSKRYLNNLSNNINNNYHIIEIFLISNYGHKNLIGLKNVKLISNYNLNCQILKFSYKNCKIINDKENIILGLNSELKPSFEIIFTLPNNHKLRDIIINNYKGKDRTICTKNIEIFYENKVIFLGKISQNSNLILQEINKKKFKYKFSPIKKIIVNRKIKNKDYVNNNITNNDMKTIIKTFKHINSLDDIKKDYKNNINNLSNNNNLNIKFQRCNSNILNSSNSLENINKLDNNNNNNIGYINCDKIKITFIENFLNNNNNNNNNNFNKINKNKIDINNNNILYGLTGLQFYIYDEIENIEKEFLIDNFKSINANPKDINTCMNLINDERIFKNLFNKNNKTNNENNMWLTIKIKNLPFIEFITKKRIKLTKIKFWNWNEKNSIENGIKIFNLNLFNNNNLIINSNFYLHKGIGEKNCDYSQDIKFPFVLKKLNEEEFKPYLNINMNHHNFGLIYNTPFLPFGFVLKFEFIKNYMNEEFIGFKYIKIYNQNGKEIDNYKTIILPKNSIIKCYNNFYNDNDNKIIMKFINTNFFNNESKDVYDCNKNNRMYFIFDDPVGISLINIENFNKENFSLKEIKILLDDNIIYEGKLKKGMNSIIFTGNKKILKLIDVNNLNLIEEKNNI